MKKITMGKKSFSVSPKATMAPKAKGKRINPKNLAKGLGKRYA